MGSEYAAGSLGQLIGQLYDGTFVGQYLSMTTKTMMGGGCFGHRSKVLGRADHGQILHPRPTATATPEAYTARMGPWVDIASTACALSAMTWQCSDINPRIRRCRAEREAKVGQRSPHRTAATRLIGDLIYWARHCNRALPILTVALRRTSHTPRPRLSLPRLLFSLPTNTFA